jgi:hypothetical protein
MQALRLVGINTRSIFNRLELRPIEAGSIDAARSLVRDFEDTKGIVAA